MPDDLGSSDIPSLSHLASTIDPEVLASGDVFEVLAHPRRRALLSVLTPNPPWRLPVLATMLAAWEQDIDETAVDEHTRDRMARSGFLSTGIA